MTDRSNVIISALRLHIAATVSFLAAIPVLLTRIPPLTDVPGHIGRLSVQTAPAGDGVLRYFTFHWAFTLNLACDLIVQLARPVLGVVSTMWLLSAATPALTVIGIFAIARATNARGAYALPWSLLFVFSLPFLWGFLNYTFTSAWALIAFSVWLTLDHRRGLRAALFLLVIPLLLIGHGVAGIAGVTMIVGHVLGEHLVHRPFRRSRDTIRNLTVLWPIMFAAAITLATWKAVGSSEAGSTFWFLHRKPASIIHLLQDQNMVFDIACILCCMLVFTAGWRWGAKLRSGPAGAVIAMIVLFVLAPGLLGGSDEIDMRVAPLIPMLAFAMQDWSSVRPDRRRIILLAGFVLLGARFGITTASFIRYDQRYQRELSALDHVPRGARILNLSQVECDSWRSERLEHISNLATTFRGAWVNSHWSLSGIHLLEVKYKPSATYYNDPSQIIFPDPCAYPIVKPYAKYRRAQSIRQAIGTLPLNAVDYLWIVNSKLPAGYHNDRLRRVWATDQSELYRIMHRS